MKIIINNKFLLALLLIALFITIQACSTNAKTTAAQDQEKISLLDINYVIAGIEREVAAKYKNLKGVIILNFVIAPTGEVKSITAIQNELNDPSKESIIINEFRALVIDNVGGSDLVFNAPLTFN